MIIDAMRKCREYKRMAKSRLKGNWASALVAALVGYFIILAVVAVSDLPLFLPIPPVWLLVLSGVSGLLLPFVGFPFAVGISNAFRLFYEREDDRVTENMFLTGFSNYWHNVGGIFLMRLKLLLWALLLLIPAFIMGFAYAMTPFILVEHPEIGVWEASRRSQEMMRGHKWRLFCLELSFIGWSLLAILSLGIGFLWLIPYMEVTEVAFYNDLKAQQGEEAVTA